MKITNRRIRRMHTALSAMAGRILPSRDTEKKVFTVLRKHLHTPFEITEDRLRKVREDNPAPDDLDASQLSVAIVEKRQREIDAILDEEQEIRDVPPHLLFEEKDLPRSFKAHEENAVGVADIVANLDVLFPIADDEAQQDERPSDDRSAA
jgi:hypothetical protein